ncbi:MAG: GFA family protein [Proteobacteria bacterium]|nr:GFA family protein [Pseudomonadota bacterium]
MTTKTIQGSCLCGKVAYAITGPINRFTQCHCSRCRKATGTAFASNLFVDLDSLEWTRGADDVAHFNLPAAARFGTAFCKTCGSPLPHLLRTGTAYVIPAGALDEAPGIEPQQIIYWGSRAPWFVHTNTLKTNDEGL